MRKIGTTSNYMKRNPNTGKRHLGHGRFVPPATPRASRVTRYTLDNPAALVPLRHSI